MKKNKIKNEQGSITLFVLLSILFFVIVLVGLYVNSINKVKKQSMELNKIQSSYESGSIDDLYNYATRNRKQIVVDSNKLLTTALEEAESMDTVVLTENVTIDTTLSIDKGIVINGNDYKITSSAGTNAISIETEEKVVIKNAEISGTARGININSDSHDVYVENTIFNVSQRGITVSTDDNDGSDITIKNCTIQNSRVSGDENSYVSSDSRGISLWEYSNANIKIENTEIKGFAYVINISGDSSYEYTNTEINVKDCTLKGRAGLNIWASKATINIENCDIIGINNESGTYEAFADLVINENANANKINVKDTRFTNYQNAIGLENENALQYMLAVRGNNNTINISGNTSFIDTTGKIDTILENESIVDESNVINITSGTYSFSVSQFIDTTLYKEEEQDGNYIVSSK